MNRLFHPPIPATVQSGFAAWLLLGLLAIGLPFSLHAESPEERFFVANQAYQAGDYAEAASLYRQLLRDQQSSALHFNLGNAEFRLGSYGLAILHFQKARALNPNDPETLANLRLAQEAAQVSPAPRSWTERLAREASLTRWTWLVVLGFWGSLALGLLPGLWNWRGPLRSGLLTLCLGTLLVSGGALLGYHSLARTGIVTQPETPLQISPTATAPARAYLRAGQEASILRQHGEFFEVSSGSNKGWIHQQGFQAVWD